LGVAVVLLHEAAVGIAKGSRVVVGGRQDFGCEDAGVPGAGVGSEANESIKRMA